MLPIELREVYLAMSVSQSFHQNHAFQVGYFSLYSLSGRFRRPMYLLFHHPFQQPIPSHCRVCTFVLWNKTDYVTFTRVAQRILRFPKKNLSYRWNVKYICKVPRKLLTNAVAMGTRFVTSLLRRPVVCVNEQLALANSLKIISIQSEMKSILSNCANPATIIQFWLKLQFMLNNLIYSNIYTLN